MYVRNKYGRSVSNRLFKMNAKDNAAGQDGMNDLSRAKTPNEKIEAAKKLNRYLSNPLEHNGLKTGASMKNKHDTDVNNRMDNYSKNVLDKYIQKHKRPEGSFNDFKKNHRSF